MLSSEQNYDNPRFVSGVVTSDIEQFKAVQTGEDLLFCDLVNLVRRSYIILKEVKRPQDIDNTHVTSLIECKHKRTKRVFFMFEARSRS